MNFHPTLHRIPRRALVWLEISESIMGMKGVFISTSCSEGFISSLPLSLASLFLLSSNYTTRLVLVTIWTRGSVRDWVMWSGFFCFDILFAHILAETTLNLLMLALFPKLLVVLVSRLLHSTTLNPRTGHCPGGRSFIWMKINEIIRCMSGDFAILHSTYLYLKPAFMAFCFT